MESGWSAKLIRLVLLLASAVASQAQEFPFADFANLRSHYPADSNTWNEDQYTEYNRQTALLLVDVVWKFRHVNKPKPGVVSELTPRRDPPTWDGQSISYPVSFARDMTQLGLMLGKDIYVGSWRKLPENKPITQHAFFDGHLVKAIDPSINSVSLVFDGNAALIMCPDTEKGCLSAQALEAIALQLFLIAHECGHYILGHQGARNLDQELAADKYAWDTLRTVAVSLHGPDERSNQYYDLLLAAAAEAPLWYQRQSKAWSDLIGKPSGADEDEIITKRIDQIDELADNLDGDHLVSDFMPERFAGLAINSPAVSFDSPPQLLVIDGVRAKSEDLLKGRIHLLAEGTSWIATNVQGVACKKTSGDDQIVIKYMPWTQVNAETMAALIRAKNWCDVIAATADVQLQPRSPDMAPYLNRALYYAGAGAFIDLSIMLSPRDRVDAEWYRRQSIGVKSWGLP